MMKKWLSVICLSTLSIYTFGAQKELTSSIKAVTVYADRAAINRQADVILAAGDHELVFKNLPVQLDNNSLQANIFSKVPATVLEVTTKQQVRLNEPNPRLQKIDEAIEQLNQQKNKLDDQAQLLDNQQNFIKAMQESVLSINKDGSRPAARELNEVMQFSKASLFALLKSRQQIVDEITSIDEQLAVLNSDHYPVAANNQQFKDVIVRVNLQQPSKISVDLSYVTPNAIWYPVYDVRFNTQADQLKLDYSGVVKQTTGEDWKNVKLTLSTAKPSLGGNIPILSPWFIDQARQDLPSVTSSYGMLSAKPATAPILMESVSAVVEDAPALKPMASVDMGMTSASFTIENTVSLNSGGSEQRVTITEIELPHTLNYIAVPKLVSSAYLQMLGTNNSDFPLISGKLNIFMDGRFITSSQLKTTMPQEILKLDLGGDEGIAVTYKPIKRFSEKTGLTNGYHKITYEYVLTVQNNKKTAQTINVYDQVPVSSDERITIKQLSPDPKLIKQDKEGKINWELTLNPQEKKELTVQFSVEYPDAMRVTGL